MKKNVKEQYVEGKLEGCKKELCACTCCDDDKVEEWLDEYFAFHEKYKDYLKSIGIKIEFIGDRVRFKNCSDGKNYKFLTNAPNKDIDPRPIDCKIYPYCVDWESIDFDNKIVHVYLWDKECPLAKNNKIPENFGKEVAKILKRDFGFLFHGAIFKIQFINKVLK